MRIKIGDFVCMHNTGIPEWWVEVIGIIRSEGDDPHYVAQFWASGSNQWQTFHLAPATAHRGMIKEVKTLPAEVVPMFRDLFLKDKGET